MWPRNGGAISPWPTYRVAKPDGGLLALVEVATTTPLTYRRVVEPFQVAATCVQLPTGMTGPGDTMVSCVWRSASRPLVRKSWPAPPWPRIDASSRSSGLIQASRVYAVFGAATSLT